MNTNEWVNKIHNLAKEKGWYNKPREAGTLHMLMVSEIAEATEEVRKGTPAAYNILGEALQEVPFKNNLEDISLNKSNPILVSIDSKPEGEAIELVDCMIRIMDYFGFKKWDLEKTLKIKTQYNETRAYRHGNKRY